MQAATAPSCASEQELPSDKAARIVEAMRVSIATRGIAGSTFDQVAREAGVSRGLLHYYFGSKERLLIEVVRRECDVRKQRLTEAVAHADSADEVLGGLVGTFGDFLGQGPAISVMFFEMISLGQRNAEIAVELAELGRNTRANLAEALRVKSESGVLELRADPDAVATFLFALADGITARKLSEPEIDLEPAMNLAISAARGMLG
ncbi:MAG: TetR/AcrR family transcriptional regulator [Solirubrobacteraceae bacterium]